MPCIVLPYSLSLELTQFGCSFSNPEVLRSRIADVHATQQTTCNASTGCTVLKITWCLFERLSPWKGLPFVPDNLHVVKWRALTTRQLRTIKSAWLTLNQSHSRSKSYARDENERSSLGASIVNVVVNLIYCFFFIYIYLFRYFSLHKPTRKRRLPGSSCHRSSGRTVRRWVTIIAYSEISFPRASSIPARNRRADDTMTWI